MRGIVVMGTGAGVGVTQVTAGLALALAGRGERVAVCKLVETGCAIARGEGELEVDGMPGTLDARAQQAYQRLSELVGPPPITVSTRTGNEALQPADVSRLLSLLGARAACTDLDIVAPYRFSADVAPAMAARLAERPIEIERLMQTLTTLADAGDVVVIDGGPGLLEPLGDQLTIADVLQRAGLPVLLVAPSRAGSGLVSQLRLNIEALQRRELDLAGVVLNRREDKLRPEEASTPFLLESVAGDVIRGVLPHIDLARRDDEEYLAERFEVHVDVDAIVATMQQAGGPAS